MQNGDKTTILLVRHGESEGNTAAVFTGHRGYPLTPIGHTQAEVTAQYIKQNYSIDAVYSSDLPRAFQTAEHIALQYELPIVTDASLRELYAGQWENKHFSDLPLQYPEDFAVWKNDTLHSRCTGGESVLELLERVYNGVVAIAKKYPGQCVAIASHATPIRTLLWKLSGRGPEEFNRMGFSCNCAVSELVFEDGSLRVVNACYTEHLQGLSTQLPFNI